jgi:hypothetical protein
MASVEVGGREFFRCVEESSENSLPKIELS